MPDGTHDRVRDQTSQSAKRSVKHNVAEIPQKMQVSHPIAVLDDLVDHFHATRRPNPAWRAFATRLLGAKLHGETCHPGHVDRVIECNGASVAEHRPNAGKSFVIQGRVKLRFWYIGPQRTTDLNCADGPARKAAAAEIVKQFAQCQAKGFFDQSATFDVP